MAGETRDSIRRLCSFPAKEIYKCLFPLKYIRLSSLTFIPDIIFMYDYNRNFRKMTIFVKGIKNRIFCVLQRYTR